MSVRTVIDALGLPPKARVDQRIPKKTLIEHGANTSSDRKIVQDGIEELFWVAALKPHNVGIPEYQDDSRTYGEIAVISLIARSKARHSRLAELIHRAIPYPTFLVGQLEETLFVSVAQKRNALNQANAVVIDGSPATAEWMASEASDPCFLAFLQALPLSAASRRNLFETCRFWRNQILGLRAARLTGTYVPAITDDDAVSMEESISLYDTLSAEIDSLRSQAVRERTIRKRVDLNLQIKALESLRERILNRLTKERPK